MKKHVAQFAPGTISHYSDYPLRYNPRFAPNPFRQNRLFQPYIFFAFRNSLKKAFILLVLPFLTSSSAGIKSWRILNAEEILSNSLASISTASAFPLTVKTTGPPVAWTRLRMVVVCLLRSVIDRISSVTLKDIGTSLQHIKSTLNDAFTMYNIIKNASFSNHLVFCVS